MLFCLHQIFYLYTTGDALGIYPENNPPEVDHLLKALNATGDEMVDVPTWAYHNKPGLFV